MQWSDVLNWAVPDTEECRRAADALLAEHPTETREDLAKRVIHQAKGWGVAAGGATGAAANPLIMFPAAVADVAAMLRIEGQMTGTIAALLDPSTLDTPAQFQADVISVVFPGAVSQALRQIGVRAGQQITKNLVRKYFGEQLVRSVSRITTRYLFVKFSQKAVLSKTVPLVGAGIGAGWNWLEVAAVGQRAVRYYQGRSTGVTGEEPRKLPSMQNVRKMLPFLGAKKAEREDVAADDF